MVKPNIIFMKAKEIDNQAENLMKVISYMDTFFDIFECELRNTIWDEYKNIYNQIKPSLRNAKELLDEISHKIREEEKNFEKIDKEIIASLYKK